MPVIKNGQWTDDDWVHLADEAPLPADGPVTVSLTRLRAEKEALAARSAPLGLRLKSGERAHEIGEEASRFALIVVEIPVYRDGRAFSAARLLRERYRYRGEIRALGHVLPDQALLFARCGVDSFDVKPQRIEPFGEAYRAFSVAYQNPRSAIGTAPSLRTRNAGFALARAAE